MSMSKHLLPIFGDMHVIYGNSLYDPYNQVFMMDACSNIYVARDFYVVHFTTWQAATSEVELLKEGSKNVDERIS